MNEKLGTPGYETISLPDPNATAVIQALFAAGNDAPMVAQIGVGIGATTRAMAGLLDNRGELHLYDLHEKVAELAADQGGSLAVAVSGGAGEAVGYVAFVIRGDALEAADGDRFLLDPAAEASAAPCGRR